MKFSFGALDKLASKLSGLIDNFGSTTTDQTNGTKQTGAPSFWQRYALNFGFSPRQSNSANNQALRSVAQNVDTWRSDGDDKKNSRSQVPTPIRTSRTDPSDGPHRGELPTPKAIIIPLKEGKKQAGYDELARRVTIATLERNGIHPSNIEMEELMALKSSKEMDMNGWLDKNYNFHDLPGLMPEAGTYKDINGNQVFGYKMTLSPKFQQSVIDDYHRITGELAATPNKKAVVDMTMNERLVETVKIAYDKGYISQEVKDKLGKMTPEELATAFALGGAIGIAATSAEGAAILGPVGAGAGLAYGVKQMAEFDHIARGAAKATSRDQLDVPAREFGQWMGQLSKDGVLMLAGMAGGAIAPRTMPKVEQVFDSVYGSVKNIASGESNLKLPVYGLPEPVPATPGVPTNRLPVPVSGAPQGTTPISIKPSNSVLPAVSGTAVGKSEPLEMRASEYKDLRKKTPSQEVRDAVNPDGPKIDPVYKYYVERLEADHIVSMKEITEMPGFENLTKAQQVEVLNLRDNFLGLGKSTNASKGAKTWADWAGHKQLGEVPPEVRARMIEIEKQAKIAVQQAINERLPK